MTNRIVIVGGGLAAARTVRSYRDAGGESPLTVLSAEPTLPYNRPPLSKGFLRGELEAEALAVESAETYADLGVDIRLEAPVTRIDTGRRLVTLADGTEIEYDSLVLATGVFPRELGVTGEHLENVHTYRTLADAQAVRAAAASARSAVVVGAGFIGMETAASLRRRGLEVTIVEPSNGLFAALRAPAVSRSLERLYRDHGVKVLLGDSIAEFQGRDGVLLQAFTTRGRQIPADLAVVGVGVQPSTGYVEGSGIAIENGAVLVNERFETNVAGVYAVGDVASFHDPVFGHRRLIQHWTNANHHGQRLGRILTGDDAPYDLVAYFFSEVFGTKLGLLGDLEAGHDEILVRGSPRRPASTAGSRRSRATWSTSCRHCLQLTSSGHPWSSTTSRSLSPRCAASGRRSVPVGRWSSSSSEVTRGWFLTTTRSLRAERGDAWRRQRPRRWRSTSATT
jgi:NADPH-dependent 2,4-dienoyl-CoA reductase/sulfur reductase-like enzyme